LLPAEGGTNPVSVEPLKTNSVPAGSGEVVPVG
jgi:hypothetical protein